MSATITPEHICYFLTSRIPRYPPDITVYLHENVILGQMSHKLSCKQFLSMKVVVGGMVAVGRVWMDLIIMTP